MKIGFIGLGKMGSQMVTRLLEARHEVVALDVNTTAVEELVSKGATGAHNPSELVSKLEKVVIWLMIPAEFVDSELHALLDIVPAGSIIIDGGNSDFRLTIKRGELSAQKQVSFIDVGTSGGVLGLKQGFSMMVGGDPSAVEQISPILDSLAEPDGWKHFGATGTGHYIKMIHNGIEYGLMQSYAEGYQLLKEGPIKNIDLAGVAGIWEHGSIVGSTLNQCIFDELRANPQLEGIEGVVAESGEARWTLEVAQQAGIATPAIQTALDVRLASESGTVSFATKLLAAMRNKFGGHAINVPKS